MIDFSRGMLIAGAILAAGCGLAQAQDNLDAGKTPAQLYASNCAICHKSPQGLGQAGGIFGLSGFLRQHYTASRESAAAIAAYVQSIDKGPAPTKRPAGKKTVKGEDKAKAKADAKPETKPETKPGEAKSSEPKGPAGSAEPKASEAKAAEPKPAETKPAEPKAAEPTPAATGDADKKPN